jgi:hypothetical protein
MFVTSGRLIIFETCQKNSKSALMLRYAKDSVYTTLALRGKTSYRNLAKLREFQFDIFFQRLPSSTKQTMYRFSISIDRLKIGGRALKKMKLQYRQCLIPQYCGMPIYQALIQVLLVHGHYAG